MEYLKLIIGILGLVSWGFAAYPHDSPEQGRAQALPALVVGGGSATRPTLLIIKIAPSVEVSGERFTLGEIAEFRGFEAEQQQRIASLELGASPAPGLTRSFTRTQLETRLRRHDFDPKSFALDVPTTVQVKRRAQIVAPDQLLNFAREQLKNVLGEEANAWQTDDKPSIPPLSVGTLSLKPDGDPRVGTSSARVGVLIQVDDKVQARVSYLFRAPARSRVVLVKSGDTVTVQVTTGNLTVETTGTARASGAQDEAIPVYLPETRKTVRAYVVNKGLVEIKP